MEISLSKDNDSICFRHAVKAVMEENACIEIEVYDDSDCGQSGCWWVGGCKECVEENS